MQTANNIIKEFIITTLRRIEKDNYKQHKKHLEYLNYNNITSDNFKILESYFNNVYYVLIKNRMIDICSDDIFDQSHIDEQPILDIFSELENICFRKMVRSECILEIIVKLTIDLYVKIDRKKLNIEDEKKYLKSLTGEINNNYKDAVLPEYCEYKCFSNEKETKIIMLLRKKKYSTNTLTSDEKAIIRPFRFNLIGNKKN